MNHVGWNSIIIKDNSKILENINNNSNFYFVHSYFVKPKNEKIIKATCMHGIEFPAVIESGNIFGIQFHPEKCQTNGLKILENFIVFKNIWNININLKKDNTNNFSKRLSSY